MMHNEAGSASAPVTILETSEWLIPCSILLVKRNFAPERRCERPFISYFFYWPHL